MAGVIKANGTFHTEDLVGVRELFFKVITLAGTTQADMDTAMQEVQLTSTIEVIGAWVAGNATVSIVISGADVATIAGTATTTVVGF